MPKRKTTNTNPVTRQVILDLLDFVGGSDQVIWSEVLEFNKVRNLKLSSEELLDLFNKSKFRKN